MKTSRNLAEWGRGGGKAVGAAGMRLGYPGGYRGSATDRPTDQQVRRLRLLRRRGRLPRARVGAVGRCRGSVPWAAAPGSAPAPERGLGFAGRSSWSCRLLGTRCCLHERLELKGSLR